MAPRLVVEDKDHQFERKRKTVALKHVLLFQLCFIQLKVSNNVRTNRNQDPLNLIEFCAIDINWVKQQQTQKITPPTEANERETVLVTLVLWRY